MKTRQRWAVLSLLCLGFLVAVVGCARTYYVWCLFSNDDLTWYSGPHWICADVEICVATVGPALKIRVSPADLTRFVLALLPCELFLAISGTVSGPSPMKRLRHLPKSPACLPFKAAASLAHLSSQKYPKMPHKPKYFYLGLSILKVSRLTVSGTLSPSLLEIPRARDGDCASRGGRVVLIWRMVHCQYRDLGLWTKV